MNEITGDANIFAYHQTEMGFGGGNSYAFIDDKQNDKLPSSFEFLDGSNQKDMVMPSFTRIDTNMTETQNPRSSNNEKTQRQNELSNAYDKLMAERNSEMKNTIGEVVEFEKLEHRLHDFRNINVDLNFVNEYCLSKNVVEKITNFSF